jgi:riboflavin synthase
VFTGIVTHVARVEALERLPGGGARLVLSPLAPLGEVAPGESIAVSGVCLTALPGKDLRFDLVPETLARTTLGALGRGDRVNLERSLRLGDALSGHWVQGHCDGVAEVVGVEPAGNEWTADVRLPATLTGTVVEKGSVTLDGVSLTVGEVRERAGRTEFRVHLIPHTRDVTTLGALRAGAALNVEVDVLGRWVEHHLRRLLGGRDGAPLASAPRAADA